MGTFSLRDKEKVPSAITLRQTKLLLITVFAGIYTDDFLEQLAEILVIGKAFFGGDVFYFVAALRQSFFYGVQAAVYQVIGKIRAGAFLKQRGKISGI